MVVAFYLPQFHPIEENDKWWGNGFTEWTNVGKAKPLFKGHYQPKVPKDLGYYDLRLPASRLAQSKMAMKYGIDGFNYWHYWFGKGKVLLEKPFTEVLNYDADNRMPFALAWANHSWTGIWNNDPKRMLLEQTYPDDQDIVDHFNYCLKAFKDVRYIRFNDKILFSVYRPLDIGYGSKFIKIWRELAVDHGLEDFYFVGVSNEPKKEKEAILDLGFDAINSFALKHATSSSVSASSGLVNKISRKFFKGNLKLSLFDYEAVIEHFNGEIDKDEKVIPTILPNWDTSPRSGKRALILDNNNPSNFRKHLSTVKKIVEGKENKLVFLKSWNEWAEGNYMEPDLKFGNKYLETFKDVFKD